MPSPVKSRFKNTYEPIFFFTKNDWEKKVYFNLDAIRVPHKTKQIEMNLSKRQYNGKFNGNENNVGASPGGRMSITGENYVTKRKIISEQSIICEYLRYWRDKNNLKNKDIVKYFGSDYTHTVGHWFRKDAGGSYPSIDDWVKLKSLLRFDDKHDFEMTETEEVLQQINYHPKGKNPGDLLEINTAKSTYKHFAIFPEKIPEIAIKSCCPKEGIVLDPFAGSGTTGLVAKKLNKKSILIDIQPDFSKIMEERIGEIKVVSI
jgi:DNA modification methylase